MEGPQCQRQGIFIEELDVIAGGVMEGAHEARFSGDGDAAHGEGGPHLGVVGHGADHPRIDRAGAAGACAAVVGGIMGVVY